jgi:LPXTG-site transpeptidase (sortase) family protein
MAQQAPGDGSIPGEAGGESDAAVPAAVPAAAEPGQAQVHPFAVFGARCSREACSLLSACAAVAPTSRSSLDPSPDHLGRRSSALVAASLVAMTLALTGCSSESPTPIVGTSSPAVSPPATQPPNAAAAPVSISIPAIGIESTVTGVGTDDRVLQIPPDPKVVGWWRDGAAPGGNDGTVVLAAHLDSRKFGNGPLVRAKELKPGAAMTLRDSEGTRHAYRVKQVDTFRKTALPYAQLFRQSGPERVVLVTCGGKFDRGRGGWDSNVVVTFDKT